MWNKEPVRQDERGRQPQAGTASATVNEPRATTLIGKSVVLKGEVISAEDTTINGRVEGTIEVPEHRLTVGPEASIRADILARAVIVLGAVNGSITASERVEISATGTVEGDVLSPKLVMADGANLRGKVETGARRATTDVRRPEVAAT